MQVKEISISYGLTINTGSFNSERVDVGATVSLSSGETEEEVTDKFLLWAKQKCYALRHEILHPDLPTPTQRKKKF